MSPRKSRAPKDGPSDADRSQDTAAAAAAANERAAAGARAPRQRRRAGGKPVVAALEAAAPEQQQQQAPVDPCESMSWQAYYPRQYGGVSIGAVACYSTITCYDQADPLRVWKLCAWMALAFVALAVHELRPFKRMNYGDKAREQGLGVRSALGL